jgi:hypothetical protein
VAQRAGHGFAVSVVVFDEQYRTLLCLVHVLRSACNVK